MDEQIFTTKKSLLSLQSLKDSLKNPRILVSVIVGVVLIIAALTSFFIFLWNGAKTTNKSAAVQKISQNQDPNTYFDAVFLNFDKEKGTILVEVTKNALATRQEVRVGPFLPVFRITYKAKSQEITSKKRIGLDQIKSGENLRIVVPKADIRFDFSKLKEIDVLAPK